MPCFEGGRTCSGKRTDAHDSGPTQPAESTSTPVIPKAVLPVLRKAEFPVFPNEAFPVVSKKAGPSRIRISQTNRPAATPDRSVSPETSHKTPEPTEPTPKSSPSRYRRLRSPARQLNHSGSLIRKIHDSHRGGFRRSPRLQLTPDGLANRIIVAIDPAPPRDRPALPPSSLTKVDNASNSQQPAAPKGPGRPRGSKNNNQATPRGTETSSAPSASTVGLQNEEVPPPQINCDCLSSAVRILEELETQNHHLQDYSGPAISQHLTDSQVKCLEILSCKSCTEASDLMMLMIIISQKITKMFSRLTTRFIEGDLLILSPEKAVPLPRLILIQQLKLERVLDHLKAISKSHDWKTHSAILAPICQYSKDTMDRLRRINGLVVASPTLVPLNEDDPIVPLNKDDPIVIDDE